MKRYYYRITWITKCGNRCISGTYLMTRGVVHERVAERLHFSPDFVAAEIRELAARQ